MTSVLLALAFAAPAPAAPITKLEGTAGCVVDASSPLAGQRCRAARALGDVTDVAVSPDGKHAYGASFTSNAVVAFRRDPATGSLTQLPGAAGCIASEGAAAAGCAAGRGLTGATAVAISPDGKNVYVTGFELDTGGGSPTARGTLASFAREPATGALTQLPPPAGCYAGDALPSTPDPSCPPAAVGTPLPPRLAPLATATDVEVSGDGRSVLTSSFLPGAVIDWARDPATGALSAKECLASSRTIFPAGGGALTDPCPAADGLAYLTDVEVAADSRRVYAAALGLESGPIPVIAPDGEDEPGSVALFDRDPVTGDLTQPSPGCVGDARDPAENCAPRTGLLNPFRIAASPDSRNVYVSALNVFPPEGVPGPGPGELSMFTSSLAQLDPPCLQQLGLPAAGLEPTPGCRTSVLGLLLPTDVGFSPDGSSAYLSSLFHSVASFDRDAATGLLGQDAPPPLGCSIDPRNLPAGTEVLAQLCQNAIPLDAPTQVEVSPEGRNVYVTSGGFLTGQAQFGPALAAAGITGDDAITIFGPTPPATQPPPPGEKPLCQGADATIVAGRGELVRGTSAADVIVAAGGGERIRSRGGADLICAAGGRDAIRAGGGADRVRGGAGADQIRGQAGKDALRGNGGGDRISGGGSGDRLNGGPGRDRCRGGAGHDRTRRCER